MNQEKTTSGAMEGAGAYNRHATPQAGGAAIALPHLRQAVASLALEPHDQPVVIAEYGSSQGKNSQAPMRVAIAALRARAGPDRPILVYHEDLPVNDFNSLFEVLDSDPDRYIRDEPLVFPCAIGRSFYGSVLPPAYVHLGWSAYAAVWLSRVPVPIAGHIFLPCTTGVVNAAFHEQAARDWETFLALRARELRPGGRLVVVLPGADDDGRTGLEALMNHANDALTQMATEGAITTDERAHMLLATFARPEHDLLAPFASNGQFCNLVVEHCECVAQPDDIWDEYQRDGDREQMASRYAAFYRATFVPSLLLALGQPGDEPRKRALSDRFEQLLRQRLMAAPARLDALVETLVLAQNGAH
ncbi:SAM-dependent methyltransferase [Paraburkholderia sp. IMGN_8]|uniref:SAM-dependent methyltransferase n=1 Tax=Paraburkholderia sp. IMGN_8 TaxID=3136564 RepID=UPI003101357E